LNAQNAEIYGTNSPHIFQDNVENVVYLLEMQMKGIIAYKNTIATVPCSFIGL